MTTARSRATLALAAITAAVIVYAAPSGYHDRAILGKAVHPSTILGKAAAPSILGKA